MGSRASGGGGLWGYRGERVFQGFGDEGKSRAQKGAYQRGYLSRGSRVSEQGQDRGEGESGNRQGRRHSEAVNGASPEMQEERKEAGSSAEPRALALLRAG